MYNVVIAFKYLRLKNLNRLKLNDGLNIVRLGVDKKRLEMPFLLKTVLLKKHKGL
jgi:hypothetical protein